jgi:hypothetical protein
MTRKVLIGAFVALGGLMAIGVSGTAALASAQHYTGFYFPLTPPGGLPPSCTFPQPAVLASNGGNGVQHGVTNKNGSWGGNTFEGDGVLAVLNQDGSVGDTLYQGHITEWDGGGNNARGQNEGGLTLTFHGTSVTDGSSLSIHVNFHSTTNANGQTTNMIQNISCS